MREVTPNYKGYKSVMVTLHFVDNGQGAGYLRIMWPDGGYVKIWPFGETETLFDLMQQDLNTFPAEHMGGEE